MIRRLAIITFLLGLMLGVAVVPIFFVLARYQVLPIDLAGSPILDWVIRDRSQSIWSNEAKFNVGRPQNISTKFVLWQLDTFRRNSRTLRTGGGLTNYGSQALLLEGTGDIYLLNVATLTEKPLTQLKVPDNGYEILLEESGEGARHIRLNWHRYTDIEFDGNYLYLAYSHFDQKKSCITSRLSRVSVTTNAAELDVEPDEWELLYVSKPCFAIVPSESNYHGDQAGGRIAVVGNATVLLTIGDYHFDGLETYDFPQDPSADYGKVMRINVGDHSNEVFSLGHRNPQGIVVTPDGTIWSVEHGPEGGDELNRIVEGENYGWPLTTFGTNYGDSVWPIGTTQGRHDAHQSPSFSWTPSIAPSDIAYLTGPHEAWRGNLMVSSLMARSLYRLIVKEGHVIGQERIEIGERLRAVLATSDNLLIFTDSGNVLRLQPKVSEFTTTRVVDSSIPPIVGTELSQCLVCHSGGGQGVAPDLCNVVGRKVAGTTFRDYSKSMRNTAGIWDRNRLHNFLANSATAIPGTTMPSPNIADFQLREEIIRNMDFFCAR